MTHVVITGRNAPQGLIDTADLVTEMAQVKHPFRDQGVKVGARVEVDGIENDRGMVEAKTVRVIA